MAGRDAVPYRIHEAGSHKGSVEPLFRLHTLDIMRELAGVVSSNEFARQG